VDVVAFLALVALVVLAAWVDTGLGITAASVGLVVVDRWPEP
jgi:hypothetical protein